MAPELQSFYGSSMTSHMSHSSAAVDEFISKCPSMNANAQKALRNHRNPFQRIVDRVRLEYYRYEVTFGLYVLTPNEKWVANTFVIVVLGLLLWGMLYFPALLFDKLGNFAWVLTGQTHTSEQVEAVMGVIDMHGSVISPISMAQNMTS
ncbi:hypothetical protein N7495_006351 [Penicillium taxi]|uniref:uncharacterized protein n=1 Tax=Penicillium taxi TaxID=168475 RepID=UPI0025457942|nr:uncharacterized protein N7495_006351 [Penicillium taxi]KAJ5894660.1 hypothetical protein N7495_006351 [Penicillium taxi]